MTNDVYQPCPMCTDKKIKFCCSDIADDMALITRQIGNGQQRMALRHLEKLASTHPDTVWNETTRALLLMDEGRGSDAQRIIEHLVEKHPEHHRLNILHTSMVFQNEGFHSSRNFLWRALRKSFSDASDILCSLLCDISESLYHARNFMAARQFLTLAMRVAPHEEKHQVFVSLMNLDSDTAIPYPLRGVHSIRLYDNQETESDTQSKALRLADRGCFGPAADRFEALANETPSNATHFYNAALCRAWADDSAVAADLFLKASEVESDFEIAAEYAVLGQMLQTATATDCITFCSAVLPIKSASHVISLLGSSPQIARLPQKERYKSPTREASDAIFEITDRPPLADLDNLSIDDVPLTLGKCLVTGPTADGGEPGQLRLFCPSKDALNQCKDQIAEITSTPVDEFLAENTNRFENNIPLGFESANSVPALPETTPYLTEFRIRTEHINRITEQWLNTSQQLLDGKTPLEASKLSEWHVKLAGLAYYWDSIVFHQVTYVDPNHLRDRLQLPRISRLAVRAEQTLHGLSSIQIQRVALDDLDDRQLTTVMNRALLVRQSAFLDTVLKECVKRNLRQVDYSHIYVNLCNLARLRGKISEAITWVQAARDQVVANEHAFSEIAQLDLREVCLRMDEGNTPQLQELVTKLTSYYQTRLPEFIEGMHERMALLGISSPRISTTLSGADHVTSGEVWPPNIGETETKKLWLPGM